MDDRRQPRSRESSADRRQEAVAVPPVALVNMPFSDAGQPSLALGLLKAHLQEKGISSTVHYFNVAYRRFVGAGVYDRISNSPSSLLIGESVFANGLWGGGGSRSRRFATLLRRAIEAPGRRFPGGGTFVEWREILRVARRRAERFLDGCLRQASWERVKIVGFSSVFQQQLASLALARKLKAAHPHLYCVFGGANCEADMGRAVFESFPFVDAVCIGEGDLAFPELALRVLNAEPPRSIPGMLQRDGADRERAGRETAAASVPAQGTGGPTAPRVEDLNTLPFPDYEDYFNISRDGREVETLPLPVETSRGCWWGEKQHCTFCGLNGLDLGSREKSAERVLSELRWLDERYGKEKGRFACVDNILPMSYFRTLLPQLAAAGAPYRFFFETKSNLRPHQVALLRSAGVRAIQPGIESLSTPLLERMRKGVTALQNVQLLRSCLQYGIAPLWNYLVGFPGESEADYAGQRQLFSALSHLPPPAQGFASRVRFDRFSPYVSNPHAFGITDLEPCPAYTTLYDGLSREAVARLAYFFGGRFAGCEEVPGRLRRLDEAIDRWRDAHPRSALIYLEAEGGLLVFDLRPDARPRLISLPEPWRTLYLECAQISGRKALRRRAQACGTETDVTDEEIDGALDQLIRGRLLLEESGRLLALAVPLSDHYRIPAAVLDRFWELMAVASRTSAAAGRREISTVVLDGTSGAASCRS